MIGLPHEPPQALAAAIEEHHGSVPSAYLYAIAWHESRFELDAENPRTHARGAYQILPGTFAEWPDRGGLPVASLDDPTVATRAAVWLIEEIMRGYARAHPESLTVEWTDRRTVELLTLGYAIGYSERAGVGRVARHLEALSFLPSQITVAAVVDHATAAGASRHFGERRRVEHALAIARTYFEIIDAEDARPRAEPRPPSPAPGRLQRRRRGGWIIAAIAMAVGLGAAVARGRAHRRG